MSTLLFQKLIGSVQTQPSGNQPPKPPKNVPYCNVSDEDPEKGYYFMKVENGKFAGWRRMN